MLLSRRRRRGGGSRLPSKDIIRSKPRKKWTVVAKVVPFVLLVLYTAWISLSLEQTLHHDEKFGGRVLVCVTGQVERLVLRKKVETLLVPLQQKHGLVVDVILALTQDSPHYTNPENGKVNAPEFDSYTSAVEYLERHDEFFRVLTREPIHSSDNSTTVENPIPPQYLAQMDKQDMPADWQVRRVENHLRQYHALNQCSKALQQHGGSLEQYSLVIRIRDDVAPEQPLNVPQLLPLLSASPRTVLTSDCRTHGGMNDRMAIVSPHVAKEYFERPLHNFLSSPIHAKVHNPESYLYYTYQEPPVGQEVIAVVQTPILRGVTKFVTNHKGRAIRANKEELLFCPTRWSKFLDLFRH